MKQDRKMSDREWKVAELRSDPQRALECALSLASDYELEEIYKLWLETTDKQTALLEELKAAIRREKQ